MVPHTMMVVADGIPWLIGWGHSVINPFVLGPSSFIYAYSNK